MARAKKTTTKTETPVEEKVNEVLEQPTQTAEQQGPQPIGQLFNVINYNNVEDLDNFIKNMTPDQGLYILVQAARAAHGRNAFGMEEAETISKAIRVITNSATPQENQPVGEPEVHKAE